ncbi:hypothetical protein NTGBS_180009 [Candidatus Nitrotoga sp. BS]|nr:hypothetical protein NTGBS_180009 [Candidatus Nitrotoga sp. BS]
MKGPLRHYRLRCMYTKDHAHTVNIHETALTVIEVSIKFIWIAIETALRLIATIEHNKYSSNDFSMVFTLPSDLQVDLSIKTTFS